MWRFFSLSLFDLAESSHVNTSNHGVQLFIPKTVVCKSQEEMTMYSAFAVVPVPTVPCFLSNGGWEPGTSMVWWRTMMFRRFLNGEKKGHDAKTDRLFLGVDGESAEDRATTSGKSIKLGNA